MVVSDPRPAGELASLVNSAAYSHDILEDSSAWQAVANGELVVVTRRSSTSPPHPPSQAGAGSKGAVTISPRRLKVLSGMAEGLSDAEIAARLGISRRTVRACVSSLKASLCAASREQLLARAVALRLIAPAFTEKK